MIVQSVSYAQMSTIESAYRKPGSKGQSLKWSRSVQSTRSPDARGSARAIGAALLTLALSTTGCHSIYLPAFMAPYRPDVQQGNVITRDMVEQLRPGMSRDQVKFMLGTPLLTDGFHPDRWDYLYYLNPRKGAPQRRNLIVYFKDNRLDHFTSDPMPPESMADNLILGQKPYAQPSAAPKEPVPQATPPAPAKEPAPQTTPPAPTKESAPETTPPASTSEPAPEAKPPASTQ
jgi:outer membrane protein assembly factor BamE